MTSLTKYPKSKAQIFLILNQ